MVCDLYINCIMQEDKYWILGILLVRLLGNLRDIYLNLILGGTRRYAVSSIFAVMASVALVLLSTCTLSDATCKQIAWHRCDVGIAQYGAAPMSKEQIDLVCTRFSAACPNASRCPSPMWHMAPITSDSATDEPVDWHNSHADVDQQAGGVSSGNDILVILLKTLGVANVMLMACELWISRNMFSLSKLPLSALDAS